MSFSDWCIFILLLQSLVSNSINTTVAGLELFRQQQFFNNFLNTSFNDAKLKALDKWLSLPTEDILNLKVMLRKNFLQQDAENVYTRWFLERSPCQITIASYTETNKKRFFRRIRTLNRLDYVIVTDMKHLRMTSERFIQRSGTFFFIISDKIDMERLKDILQKNWIRFNVIKNFILTPLDDVLIFDPFEYDEKHNAYGMIRSYAGDELLESSLFKDMRGYPLRIQIFKSVYAFPIYDKHTGKFLDVAGLDGEVAHLLAKIMNFTMILQEPDPDYFGERNANGTYNGAIGSIINNEIDMCLTGFFVKDYMVPEMDFTVAVYDDRLCIYVPKASRIPQSILPIFAVSYNIWISFIATAFACGTIWWIIRRINLWLGLTALERTLRVVQKSHCVQFMRIYIDTWVVWVRVNVIHYPPFHSERIFVASLSLVSVIFGAIFDSSLATVYIHPMYYNDIRTLQELDQSGLKIIYKYSSMADDLFFSETSTLFANLNKKLKHLSDLNADVILDIAYNGDKAGVTRYTSLMSESLHFVISKRIWLVPECPKYYTISYVMPKDAPWEKMVNDLLLRFLNAGLISKWISDMDAKNNRNIMKEQLFETIETFKILTISDLQLAFYVVFVGSSLAIVSFLVEIFFKKF